MIFTRLFYLHWSTYTHFKRTHLFVVPAGGGTAKDITPGDHDVPPFNLGGQDMYAISPDGQELAYTSNIDEVEATSTNDEIFVVPINTPSNASSVEANASPARTVSPAGPNAKPPGTAATTAAPRKISTSPGADTTPLYSPDGKYLAWRSQARAGFEADKWRLIIYERASAKLRDRTEKIDLSVGSFTWTVDSKQIYFAAEDHGDSPVYVISLTASAAPTKLVGAHNDDLVFSTDGKSVFFTRVSV